MIPTIHAFLGAIFSVFLFKFFDFSFSNSLLIFLSSFLFDFDHYIFYVFKRKNFNPFKCLNFYKELDDKYNRKIYLGIQKYSLCFFHTIEFLFFIFAISLFYPIFKYILIGLLFHISLDVIYESLVRKQFRKSYSVIHFIFLNPNYKEY